MYDVTLVANYSDVSNQTFNGSGSDLFTIYDNIQMIQYEQYIYNVIHNFDVNCGSKKGNKMYIKQCKSIIIFTMHFASRGHVPTGWKPSEA